jgi:High potential iron-sulfur protein
MIRMSRIQSSGKLSRRTVIVRSVACAAGAASLLGPVTEASAKMAQKIAEYQETPKGDQQCSNCSLFQEPNACTLVDGEISPSGWCKFWVKKTS